MVKVKRTQKESTSLIALRAKSSVMPKEMGLEEQNIGEKGTSEKVLKPVHSNVPQTAGQLLSCDAINNRHKEQELSWISAAEQHWSVRLLFKTEETC